MFESLTVKNHTRIASVVNSAAYTPPPAAANACPYELVFLSVVVHPEPEFAAMEQLFNVNWPVMVPLDAMHLTISAQRLGRREVEDSLVTIGVEGDLIGGLSINTLHDINLAACASQLGHYDKHDVYLPAGQFGPSEKHFDESRCSQETRQSLTSPESGPYTTSIRHVDRIHDPYCPRLVSRL